MGWCLKIFPFASLGSRAGGGMVRYVVTLACFALIRHWRATFPTRGKASFGCAKLFCFTSQSYRKIGTISQSYRKIGAVSSCYEPPRGAFPRVGKVARQRRMRAKQASAPHNASHQHQPSIHIPRPCNPPCHPERSGTTRKKSSAPTNHCRTANPAPSGAPAGGISVAPRYYVKQRTAQRSLPLRGGRWRRRRRMRAGGRR